MDTGAKLSALADGTRRSILELLRARPRSVADLAVEVPVSRPAVSQHLKALLEAGLVSVDQQGTRRIYAIDPAGWEDLRIWIEQQWDEVLDRFSHRAREEHAMPTYSGIIAPVTKSRTVALEVEQAFDLFTARIGEWWPVATHSINAAPDLAVRFEGRVGGRVVEIAADGSEYSWADVLAWNPPHRFVLSWHPNREPEAASTLEVRFAPAPAGGTEVTLEHRGWEEFGDTGPELRDNYDSGWDVVLAPFEGAATT